MGAPGIDPALLWRDGDGSDCWLKGGVLGEGSEEEADSDLRAQTRMRRPKGVGVTRSTVGLTGPSERALKQSIYNTRALVALGGQTSEGQGLQWRVAYVRQHPPLQVGHQVLRQRLAKSTSNAVTHRSNSRCAGPCQERGVASLDALQHLRQARLRMQGRLEVGEQARW